MVLIHLFHMHNPSQYSLICSTRYLPFYSSSPMHLFILNSIHSWHSNQTSQTLHRKNIKYLLSALLIPYASTPYNAVGTITPSYRHFLPLSPLLYCSAYCSALPTLYTPHSFGVPYPFHILYQLQVLNYNNQLPLMISQLVSHAFDSLKKKIL